MPAASHFNLPRLNDRNLDYTTYSNMVSLSKKLSNLRFDPTQFMVQEDPTGIYVSSILQGNGASEPFTHHWITEMANAAAGTFYIADGWWDRNGEVATYTNVAAFDPITEGLITTAYSGTLYNYAVRMSTDGGTDAIEIVTSPDASIESHNQMHISHLISAVEYVNGSATDITQSLISDPDDHQTMSTTFEDFGITITKPNKFRVGAAVGGGLIRRRDQEFQIAGASETDITEDRKVWIDLGLDTTSADCSLLPQSPKVVFGTAFPTETGYANRFIRLYDITYGSVDIGDTGSAYADLAVTRHHYGDLKDDWVRPDGKDCGISGVDSELPRVKSLDFVTSAGSAHAGELQDFQAYEKIIKSGTFYDQDKILPTFNYSTANGAEKDYIYIDTHGSAAGHTEPGKSLERQGYYLQLRGFSAGSPTTAISDMRNTGSSYQFLAREFASGSTGQLMYLDLATAMVGSAATAGYASTSGTSLTAGTAFTAGTVMTALHSNLYWTPTSKGTAGQNEDHDYRYWVDGETYTSAFGQSIGYGTAGRPGASPEIRIDLSENTDCPALVGDTDWNVGSALHFNIHNTDAGSSLNTGCLRLDGGFSASAQSWLQNAAGTVSLNTGVLGAFTGTATTALLADTTIGGSFYFGSATTAQLAESSIAGAFKNGVATAEMCSPNMGGRFLYSNVTTAQMAIPGMAAYFKHNNGNYAHILETDSPYRAGAFYYPSHGTASLASSIYAGLFCDADNSWTWLGAEGTAAVLIEHGSSTEGDVQICNGTYGLEIFGADMRVDGVIEAVDNFKCGGTNGKGGTVTFADYSNVSNVVTIKGGIITSWTQGGAEQLT